MTSSSMAPYMSALVAPLPSCDLPPRRNPLSADQKSKYEAVLRHFDDEAISLPRSLKAWKAMGGGNGRPVGLSAGGGGGGGTASERVSRASTPSLASSPPTRKDSTTTGGQGGRDEERTGLSDEEKCFLSRECLLRYLRAVKWDLKAAIARTEEVVVWRREYGVDRDADLDLLDQGDEDVETNTSSRPATPSSSNVAPQSTASTTATTVNSTPTPATPTTTTTTTGEDKAKPKHHHNLLNHALHPHQHHNNPTPHKNTTYPPLPNSDPRRRPSQIPTPESSRASSPAPTGNRARAHTHAGFPSSKKSREEGDEEGAEEVGGKEWRGLTAEEVEEESKTGKQFVLGYDVHSRPCLHMYPYRQNTKVSPRQIRFVVWCLERTIDLMPPGVETLALLIDFGTGKAGGGGQPTTLGQARQVLTILQTYYAERLGRAICVNVPFLFWGFYKLVGPFIDPVTKEKIRFNPNVRELVPAEQLEKDCFGGDLDFKYDHEAYYPTLTRLAAERRSAMMKRWRQHGHNRCGASEWVLRGGDQAHVGTVESRTPEGQPSRAGSVVSAPSSASVSKPPSVLNANADAEQEKKEEKEEKRSSRPRFAKHDRGDSVHSMHVPSEVILAVAASPSSGIDGLDKSEAHEDEHGGEVVTRQTTAGTSVDRFYTPAKEWRSPFAMTSGGGGTVVVGLEPSDPSTSTPAASGEGDRGGAGEEERVVKIRDDDAAELSAKDTALSSTTTDSTAASTSTTTDSASSAPSSAPVAPPAADHSVGHVDFAPSTKPSSSDPVDDHLPSSGPGTPSKQHRKDSHAHHGFMHHLKEAIHRGRSSSSASSTASSVKEGKSGRRGTKGSGDVASEDGHAHGREGSNGNGGGGKTSRASSRAASFKAETSKKADE